MDKETEFLTDKDLSKYREIVPIDSCVNCKFWHLDEAPSWRGSKKIPQDVIFYAQCRKNSPVLEIIGKGTDDEVRISEWPPTDGYQWCGEFSRGEGPMDLIYYAIPMVASDL